RDITEHAMIEHAVRERLPLLGVCRGMQMLNTYFGGQIVRDVSAICGHPEAHVAVSHTVDFIDAKYQRQFGTSIAQTNSFHRQAVTSSTLAAELRPFAVARDGIVEGIYHPELPIVGIQWHPERAKSPVKVDRILIDNWLGRR
ncbi:MAG: gamma-glutamyl-gamma-aminobutyrate hydrolase family protein, partial [Gammaproteobacteria bacterium]|nr:gamma-glutamyl-gamma-aminobutyrate hydrolase family protein [Gammaproteobacteria bacterium]